ncbi:MAG: hypothetical protein FWH17_11670 [Oscillospiraceae bacterium]|nr:hypothetical protein [Oscillospiraceae bacterium]
MASFRKRFGDETLREINEMLFAPEKKLLYIRRNLGYIDNLMKNYDKLSPKQKAELDTIRELYKQQKKMIDNRTHTVEDRIVSISQLHVRPIA